MSRTITAAAAVAALAVLGACGRGDNAAYDSAAGTTAGAMATPPAPIGMSVGASTTVGATTSVLTDTTITKSKTKAKAAKKPY